MARTPRRAVSLLAPALLAGALLAGCSGAERTVPAGARLDEGGFGNPTLANRLAMTGEGQLVGTLDDRFAQAVETTVTFPFDSAALSPEAQATLRRQAHWIRQFPEVRFRVYGHTDLVGSPAYNHALGLRRARAAVAFLAQEGVSPSRLEALVSFGETRPLVPTGARERLNRRTVTAVSGFVHGHPTLLNGKYAQVVFREYVASATEAPPATDAARVEAP